MKKENLTCINYGIGTNKYFYKGDKRQYILTHDQFITGEECVIIEIELRSKILEIYCESFGEAFEKIEFMENSNLLKILRVEAGLTQQELSDLSDVSVRMIQNYEQGVKNINHAKAITLYNLSNPLGCAIEDLLEF